MRQQGFSAIGMVLTLALVTGVIAYFISERSSLSLQAQKATMDEIKTSDFIEFSTMYLRSNEKCKQEIRMSNQGKIGIPKNGALSKKLDQLNLKIKGLNRTQAPLPGGSINTLSLAFSSNKRTFKGNLYLYFVTNGNTLVGCKSTALDPKSKDPIEVHICDLLDKGSYNPATGFCES